MLINLFLLPYLFFTTSIYSFAITTIDGKTIQLSEFKGKKMLIVNTAGNSRNSYQYAELEQLYQRYKNTLVILAFPSNDFNSEPGKENALKNNIEQQYHIHYILCSKTSVKGDTISPLYRWLTRASENGSVDNPVDADFFKFLISRDGEIIGIFNNAVSPVNSELENAVAN
jgi:glutathione peroxidase